MRGILLAVVVFASPFLMAQAEPGCLERTIPVQLLVRGDRIKDPGKLSYRASLDNKPVEIVSMSVATGTQRVVLVIDASASMGPSPYAKIHKPAIEFAFELGADAVKKLPPATLMSLILCGKREDKLDFAVGRGALLRKLDQSQPAILKVAQGKTPLFDAIREAVMSIPSPQAGDAVYVITDGADNQSKTDKKDVLHALQASGVRLFVFLLDQYFHWSGEKGRRDELTRLAEHSGGRLISFKPRLLSNYDPASPAVDFTPDAKMSPELDFALTSLYQAIAAPTLLRIHLPRAPSSFQSWKLEVTDELGRVQKDASFSYARELAPCAKP